MIPIAFGDSASGYAWWINLRPRPSVDPRFRCLDRRCHRRCDFWQVCTDHKFVAEFGHRRQRRAELLLVAGRGEIPPFGLGRTAKPLHGGHSILCRVRNSDWRAAYRAHGVRRYRATAYACRRRPNMNTARAPTPNKAKDVGSGTSMVGEIRPASVICEIDGCLGLHSSLSLSFSLCFFLSLL